MQPVVTQTPINERPFDRVLAVIISLLLAASAISRLERRLRRRQVLMWVDARVANAIHEGTTMGERIVALQRRQQQQRQSDKSRVH